MYYKVVQRKHRAQERAPPLFGGVKVIGNFAEHAPKQRPFGGILPLQGSFLSIYWLVLAAIFFVCWIFCTARARFDSSLGRVAAVLRVLALSQALS